MNPTILNLVMAILMAVFGMVQQKVGIQQPAAPGLGIPPLAVAGTAIPQPGAPAGTTPGGFAANPGSPLTGPVDAPLTPPPPPGSDNYQREIELARRHLEGIRAADERVDMLGSVNPTHDGRAAFLVLTSQRVDGGAHTRYRVEVEHRTSAVTVISREPLAE